MKKFYFFLLSLFYFGCSSEPEADYISEEILAGSRASNSANDIRFTCSDLDNDDYCDDDHHHEHQDSDHCGLLDQFIIMMII